MKCMKCADGSLKLAMPNSETIIAACESCGYQAEFIANGDTGSGDRQSKTKIIEAGQPCRKCGRPVGRGQHTKAPKYKPGGYYYEWWFKCDPCKAQYFVEAGKRLFDTPQGPVIAPKSYPPFVPHFTREEIESQTGDPPW